MELKSVIVVLYNQKRPELFFSVASIIRYWESFDDAVVAIASDCNLLSNEARIRQLIARDLSFISSDEPFFHPERQEIIFQEQLVDDNCQLNYRPKQESEDDQNIMDLIPPLIRYIVLDIGPKNPKDMEHIISFFDLHEDEIILWLDTVHPWHKNQIAYLNHRHPLLLPVRRASPLRVLNKLSYQAPRRWLKAEKILSHLDLKTLDKNYLAQRYFQAISASKVISQNLNRDNTSPIFMLIAMECADSKKYHLINDMCDYYQEMQLMTKTFTNYITTNWGVLKKLKKCGRPVGYLRLDYAPENIDILGILQVGARLFPWLFILDYSLDYDGQEKIEAVSVKLNQRWQYANSRPDKTSPRKQLIHELYLKVRYAQLVK